MIASQFISSEFQTILLPNYHIDFIGCREIIIIGFPFYFESPIVTGTTLYGILLLLQHSCYSGLLKDCLVYGHTYWGDLLVFGFQILWLHHHYRIIITIFLAH